MFDNIRNFRDVGAHINRIYGSKIMKEGVLFRSAMPDNASSRDKQRLLEEFHISTIIDLRSNTEHTLSSKKTIQATSQNNQQAHTPPSEYPHLLNLPNTRQTMVNLVGWNLQKYLLWQLTWSNLAIFLSNLATGYRDAATAILTSQVMQPRGLIGLAKDTLTASQTEINTLFTHLGMSETYPTIIHCTQGKDRTGLIVLLLLLLVNEPGETTNEHEDEDGEGRDGIIPLSVMADDYNASQDELRADREERVGQMREFGLTEEFADCAEGFVDEVAKFLDAEYTGVRGYLRSVGVSDDTLNKIRKSLTV